MREKYSGHRDCACIGSTAILIVANLLLGLSMVALPISPRKTAVVSLAQMGRHRRCSFLTGGAARYGARSVRIRPRCPCPNGNGAAAVVAHGLLYMLLLVIPISGWLYSSATGVQVVYLGVLPLPDLVPKDKALAGTLKAAHVTLNSVLFSLVCVHTAAALRHHFVERDTVLSRMLPISSPKESPG